MSGDDTGKMTAHELGLILGKLEGIHRSQSKMENQLDTQSMSIAAIQTDVAVIKSVQTTQTEAHDALEARVDKHSQDLSSMKGTWKMAVVRYTGTGGLGAGLLLGLLKLFGIKLGIGGGE